MLFFEFLFWLNEFFICFCFVVVGICDFFFIVLGCFGNFWIDFFVCVLIVDDNKFCWYIGGLDGSVNCEDFGLNDFFLLVFFVVGGLKIFFSFFFVEVNKFVCFLYDKFLYINCFFYFGVDFCLLLIDVIDLCWIIDLIVEREFEWLEEKEEWLLVVFCLLLDLSFCDSFDEVWWGLWLIFCLLRMLLLFVVLLRFFLFSWGIWFGVVVVDFLVFCCVLGEGVEEWGLVMDVFDFGCDI